MVLALQQRQRMKNLSFNLLISTFTLLSLLWTNLHGTSAYGASIVDSELNNYKMQVYSLSYHGSGLDEGLNIDLQMAFDPLEGRYALIHFELNNKVRLINKFVPNFGVSYFGPKDLNLRTSDIVQNTNDHYSWNSQNITEDNFKFKILGHKKIESMTIDLVRRRFIFNYYKSNGYTDEAGNYQEQAELEFELNIYNAILVQNNPRYLDRNKLQALIQTKNTSSTTNLNMLLDYQIKDGNLIVVHLSETERTMTEAKLSKNSTEATTETKSKIKLLEYESDEIIVTKLENNVFQLQLPSDREGHAYIVNLNPPLKVEKITTTTSGKWIKSSSSVRHRASYIVHNIFFDWQKTDNLIADSAVYQLKYYIPHSMSRLKELSSNTNVTEQSLDYSDEIENLRSINSMAEKYDINDRKLLFYFLKFISDEKHSGVFVFEHEKLERLRELASAFSKNSEQKNSARLHSLIYQLKQLPENNRNSLLAYLIDGHFREIVKLRCNEQF